MSKIKFAVIGTGHIGKRHAEMIVRNSESSLVALCDIIERDKLALEDYDVPFYNSYKTMLAKHPDLDVVCICTPNGSHSEIAVDVLNSEKHVVIEKPIGLSKAKCENVIYKALQKHKQVFAVMQNRYSPPSVWLKDIVDNKVIGDVFMVQIKLLIYHQ